MKAKLPSLNRCWFRRRFEGLQWIDCCPRGVEFTTPRRSFAADHKCSITMIKCTVRVYWYEDHVQHTGLTQDEVESLDSGARTIVPSTTSIVSIFMHLADIEKRLK